MVKLLVVTFSVSINSHGSSSSFYRIRLFFCVRCFDGVREDKTRILLLIFGITSNSMVKVCAVGVYVQVICY